MLEPDDIEEFLNTAVSKLELDKRYSILALELFNKIRAEKHITRSRSLSWVACSCLFYIIHTDPSCPPISFKIFNKKISPLKEAPPPTYLGRYYRLILEHEGSSPQKCALRPTIYVKDILAKINASEKTCQIGYDLCVSLIKKGFHIGINPNVLAARICYIALIMGGEYKTMKACSFLFDITETSIRGNDEKGIHAIVSLLGIEKEFQEQVSSYKYGVYAINAEELRSLLMDALMKFGASEKSKNIALEICGGIIEKKLCRASAINVVVAEICYIALNMGGDFCSKMDVARTLGVSKVFPNYSHILHELKLEFEMYEAFRLKGATGRWQAQKWRY